MRVPHHKKTAGGTLTARASRARTETYADDTAVAHMSTVPASHQAAQTLDRRSLGGVQESLLTVPHPSTNGRPASVTAATSRARPDVIREKTMRPHRDFGNHLYKDAHTRRRLAEPENSHPLVGVDERMYRSEMREYAVYGGVPAIAPPTGAHSTLDHPPSSPYAVDYPVSAEVTQEYARGPSSTGYQVVASPTDSHGHPQMVSAPAGAPGDASYDLMPPVGNSGSTSAEKDVSYEPSRLNTEYCQLVDEDQVVLMIQNILQQVQEITAGGDIDNSGFASQHQMSYPQHSVGVPEVYPYSASSLPLASPPAHFSGDSGPPQFSFPTSRTHDFPGVYDQHLHAATDVHGLDQEHEVPSLDARLCILGSSISTHPAQLELSQDVTVSRLLERDAYDGLHRLVACHAQVYDQFPRVPPCGPQVTLSNDPWQTGLRCAVDDNETGMIDSPYLFYTSFPPSSVL